MKFAILTFLVTLSSNLFVAADRLDVRELGFILFGKHGDGDDTSLDPNKCPLGVIPHTVFRHKTFKRGDHFFTLVRPVLGKVTELVCGNHKIWKGETGESLLDLHFVGNKDSKKFVHLEYVHRLGGVVDSYLVFEAGAHPKELSMVEFVAAAHDLVPGLHLIEGLPAHRLTHAFKLHSSKSVVAIEAVKEAIEKAKAVLPAVATDDTLKTAVNALNKATAALDSVLKSHAA